MTSGDLGFNGAGYFQIMGGKGATTIAIQGNRMIMAYESINRVLTDGSTGEFNMQGPKIGVDKFNPGYGGFGKGKEVKGPTSSALALEKLKNNETKYNINVHLKIIEIILNWCA